MTVGEEDAANLRALAAVREGIAPGWASKARMGDSRVNETAHLLDERGEELCARYKRKDGQTWLGTTRRGSWGPARAVDHRCEFCRRAHAKDLGEPVATCACPGCGPAQPPRRRT